MCNVCYFSGDAWQFLALFRVGSTNTHKLITGELSRALGSPFPMVVKRNLTFLKSDNGFSLNNWYRYKGILGA